MKKVISIAITFVLILMFTACGSKVASNSYDIYEGDTMGAKIYQGFIDKMTTNPNASAQELADDILLNPVIDFMGAAMPVEEGYLAGFKDEVRGFKEAVMFSPMIGSIPFVGYVFTLNDSKDAESFKKTLENLADPRWNICTQADETVIKACGDKIFFLMCSNETEDNNESANNDGNNDDYYMTMDEPTFATVEDGFDNDGFTYFECKETGKYQFEKKDSDDVTWTVYVLNEQFDDAPRFIPQVFDKAVEDDGSIDIKEGQYVYIQCSENAFTADDNKNLSGAIYTYKKVD